MKPTKVLYVAGPAGKLEVNLNIVAKHRAVVLLCHPHPLHGGTMENKVITSMVSSFNRLHLSCVRFNYRGVGQSAGEYGDLVGEYQDGSALCKYIQQQWPTSPLWLAGFSFGSYISAQLTAEFNAEQLLNVAPSVVRMPFINITHTPNCPWTIIQGTNDEVVAEQDVKQWFDLLTCKDKNYYVVEGASHFFDRKLKVLQDLIIQHYANFFS